MFKEIISQCMVLIFLVVLKSKPAISSNVEWQCSDLFDENVNQSILNSAIQWKYHPNETITDLQLYEDIALDCDSFVEKQNYFLNLMKFENEESEDQFRIAYSIVVYKSAVQVERLLRVIYRPWNYYCIHVDNKSNIIFSSAIEELVKCLNSKYGNILFTKNRVDIEWGTMTVLVADLNCMEELYDEYSDWKYLINLTGQEFPLKTNAELVKILRAYKGANNIDGIYKHSQEFRAPTINLPFPIYWIKGSTHIVANRKFIQYIFESEKSKIILEALEDRFVPDEQFYNTLNYNPQLRIPGSFIGIPDDFVPGNDTRINFLTRFKNWGDYSCESGKVVRQICIWGVGDLRKLIRVPHLFTNKFHEDFQPATLKCLEQWYYDKVESEMRTGKILINSTFYSSLPFVKHQFNPEMYL